VVLVHFSLLVMHELPRAVYAKYVCASRKLARVSQRVSQGYRINNKYRSSAMIRAAL
jgi:hypothetical protein